MSYNGSGTFNINTTGQPVVAGTVISSSSFNSLTNDLATGLTTAITKDGQTTTTARITFAQGLTSSLVTDSSSVSTGSIITGGGVGIAKALYVGTTANVAGAVTLGGIATFSAQPIFSSLTASSAVATDASKGLVSVTNTGTGNNVLATAPTIASLNLTTALTLASASGTAGQVLTSGGSGGAPTWSSPSTTSISNGTSNVTVNSSGGTITAATNGTTAITIDTSQNVGIGTASPSTKLHVKGGNDNTIYADNTGQQYSGLGLYNNGTRKSSVQWDNTNTLLNIVNDGATPITFGTSGTERMRIDSSGNLKLTNSNNIASITQTAISLTGAGGGGTGGQTVNIITANSTTRGFLIVGSTQNCSAIFFINASNAVNLSSQTTNETRFSATSGASNTANVYASGSNIVLQNNIQASRDFYVTYIGQI